MTRKKTTTGTMGSKRKTDSKKDKAEKAKAKEQAAPKAVEQKAHEVIPEVAVELLATYETLPDRAAILAEFADHYRDAAARALEAASAPPEPEPEAVVEEERPRLGQRRRKPTIDTPARYATRPQPSLTSVAGIDAPEGQGEGEPAAVVESSEDVPSLELPPPFEGAADAEEMASAIAPADPASEVGFEARPSSEVEPLSPFGAAPEADDLFALLKGDAPTRTVEEDLDFSYQTSQDQSSPFLVTPGAPAADDGATRMMSAFEDDGDALLGTPISQEALEAEIPTGEVEAEPAELIAPSDATTMIQAIADDDEEAAAPSAEPTPGPATRKSRKSSRKRKG